MILLGSIANYFELVALTGAVIWQASGAGRRSDPTGDGANRNGKGIYRNFRQSPALRYNESSVSALSVFRPDDLFGANALLSERRPPHACDLF
jgi:hypothetical protein